MKTEQEYLLDPGLLPTQLWNGKSKTLSLPVSLSEAYKTLVDVHNLWDLARARNPKDPPVGGLNQGDTDKHFAQAFDGSSARAQLAVLDPERKMSRVANAFINALSGNEICITDAPCGAGAATAAFLSTVAQLREFRMLPRHPLDVKLIGAEISQPARNYAIEIFEKIDPALRQQAIFVNTNFLHWDVTDQLSNTNLIQQIGLTTEYKKKLLLIVANFNEFLEKQRKRKDADPQIEELFRHAASDTKKNVAVWIEPQMNSVTNPGGLFSWLIKSVTEKWKRYAIINKEGKDHTLVLQSKCKFRSPLFPSKTHNVRLSVVRLDLEK